MTGRLRAALAALCLVPFLAGCASDPTLPAATTTLAASTQAVLGRLALLRPAPPAAAPAPLTRARIDASARPLRIITLEARRVTDAVAETHRIGDVAVHRTVPGLLFAFRDGVLVATRGLGPDLMSADVPSAASLRRASGGHRRVHDYLTGTDATLRLALDCTLAPGGSETLDLFGLALPTRIVVERCAAPGLAIENRYWFDAQGRIRQAREWIGPAAGHIVSADPMR
jgi:hypothetical protein